MDEVLALPYPELLTSWLSSRELVTVYGPPKCGKSFLVQSLAVHLSSGLGVDGAPQPPARVLYVCAEGLYSLKPRLEAMRQHLSGEALSQVDGSLRILGEALDFRNQQSVEVLVSSLNEFGPDLVIIDTLARCFGSGKENENDHMTGFVTGCEYLRAELSCAVLIVHHTTKSTGGERGHGALRGAMDTMIRASISRGTVTLTRDGSRLWPEGMVARAKLEPIKVDEREDGSEVTSCLVSWDRDIGSEAMSQQAKERRDRLRDIVDERGPVKICEFEGEFECTRKTLQRDLATLKEEGYVKVRGNGKDTMYEAADAC